MIKVYVTCEPVINSPVAAYASRSLAENSFEVLELGYYVEELEVVKY